jgi:hypothetical protein
MEKVFISNVSTGGSDFGKVSVDYIPQKDDGTGGTAIPFGWDIAANSKPS